jgi:glycosyltransferase involved in cell wall biosynthesis
VAVPLEAGIDHLVASLLRLLGEELRFVVVSTCAEHQLGVRRVSEMASCCRLVYEIGTVLDRGAWASAIERLAKRFEVSSVLLLGSDPWLDPALSTLRERGAELVAMAGEGEIRTTVPVDRWLVLDAEMKTRLEAAGFPGDRVAQLPCAWPATGGEIEVSAARRAVVRSELGVSADAFVVATLADLVTRNRPEDVVAVARRFRLETDVEFVVAGEGPLTSTIHDLARYFELPRFTLVRPSHTPAEFVAAADLVLDPAETAVHRPGVVAAVAGGRPVVATRGCGVGELLKATGAPGRCVDSIGDAAAIEQAIRELRTESPPGAPDQARRVLRSRRDRGLEDLRQALVERGRPGSSE